MADVRDRLIELLHSGVRCPGTVTDCGDCPHHSNNIPCDEFGATVDMLLANGFILQEWISVEDRLPDKHDRYLCNVKAFSFPDLRYFAILKYDDGGFIEGKIYTDDVTHWMPLPQPPEEAEKALREKEK